MVGQSSSDECFPLSRRGGPVVSRRERACSRRETNGARTRAKGWTGGRRGNKERKQVPGLYAAAEVKMRESGGA